MPKPESPSRAERPFVKAVHQKARRKLKARQTRKAIWYGLGLFGMVGWSVAIPAMLGIALGIWIDRHSSSPYSWTLMLLAVGVLLGCWNAWYWVSKEQPHD